LADSNVKTAAALTIKLQTLQLRYKTLVALRLTGSSCNERECVNYGLFMSVAIATRSLLRRQLCICVCKWGRQRTLRLTMSLFAGAKGWQMLRGTVAWRPTSKDTWCHLMSF